jgi:hypothetical protein
MNNNALKKSSETTVAAVAGALASVFFYKWIETFPWWEAGIFIVLYTLLIFGILYKFFKQ